MFKSTLGKDLQESRPSIIHVMDLSAPTMKIILFFIYTGELQAEWTEVPVEELVYGADKYKLRDLLEFFDHLMINGCNFHNALRLAQLAERHSLMNAKESILRLIERCVISWRDNFWQYDEICLEIFSLNKIYFCVIWWCRDLGAVFNESLVLTAKRM